MNKILCIGKKVAFGQRQDFVSKEEWEEIFKDYDSHSRYHVANLAAHNWDVAIVNGRCFMGAYSSDSSHWLDKDGTKTYLTPEELDKFYPPTPNDKIGWNGHCMNWKSGYWRQKDLVIPE